MVNARHLKSVPGRKSYDVYMAQVQGCDTYVAQHYATINPTSDAPPSPLGSAPKPNSQAKNAPAFDVRGCLSRILSVDPTAIAGLGRVAPKSWWRKSTRT